MSVHSKVNMENHENTKKELRVLIMTSVAAEQSAINDGLQADKRFDVALAGVGPMSAAAKTAAMLEGSDYSFVVNMGIAGGFPGVVEIGEVVVATTMVAADLGAESEEGFKPIEELGFGQSVIPCNLETVEKVKGVLQQHTSIRTHARPILTLSTVTGTSDTLEKLKERFPEAGAEAMEGFGVATAANLKGIPSMEIRAVSNLVGPRDRGAWRIKDALASLTKVSSILKEVL